MGSLERERAVRAAKVMRSGTAERKVCRGYVWEAFLDNMVTIPSFSKKDNK